MCPPLPDRPINPDRLTPKLALALLCMMRGPISGRWNGEWVSALGDHTFNTHTIAWLAWTGWAALDKSRTALRITPEGRGALQQQDHAA